ncbi:TIGR02221 family CRISPR-associated protein [Aceticella autotrophica]|uniref:TIGR02221 family CRISPR-associated protein n=1 Tax=Aceticella autotrophica TaxID=2755338 RepID=A0A975AW39_9THEO|nr:TIGR02221 family CRISPR-associated protein [Aceticella autotrophica]QSZ27542.1 TIGR02221 family CRISPR-associated protein [Aceticella autotrophica]
METVLISFIGKGRTSGNGSGYIKTKYKFDDKYTSDETAFFGSALFTYLKSKKHNIDKWFIFGTKQSSWSELVSLLDSNQRDKEVDDLYYKVFEEEQKGISDKILNKWQECLNKYIESICLIKVDPMDFKVYANMLLELLPEDEISIIFDMTHAFRYMPVLMAFSLMYVNCFKNFKGIDVYYGALEMGTNDEKPVVKIDFINQLFSLTTSYEIYKNSGYFPSLLKNMGVDDSEETYFKLEMNRSIKREIEDLIKKIEEEELENGEGYIKKAASNLKNEFNKMNKLKYLDERMLERANFFYEKKQYLIAMTLLYEAILVKAERVFEIKRGQNETRNDHNSRVKRVKEEIKYKLNKNLKDTFKNLEYARNSAVHGEEAKCTQNILECKNKFDELFSNSKKVYNSIPEN